MLKNAGDVNIFDLQPKMKILKRPQGLRKKGSGQKKQCDYIDIITAFDIETTTIETPDDSGEMKPHSFMYIWQFQYGQELTVIGRTWDEFKNFLELIEKALLMYKRENQILEQVCVMCYVHNLAYEFQFLQGVFHFENENCFFKDERKPLYIKIGNLEIRDSLALSNMSLAKFAENTGCEIRKQSGQKFDYSKIRLPWTELTPEEIEYCIDDVIVLEEAVRRKLAGDGDTLYTVPLTSTGYVRRDCKRAISHLDSYIKSLLPGTALYRMLRKAFRGGNTHANRYHTGKILTDVYSYDIESAYPAQQLIELFPMNPFKELERNPAIERIFKFISRGYAVLMEVEFSNLKLKDRYEPMPYISYGSADALRPTLDNGRVMRSEYVRLFCTELDFEILLDQYEFEHINIPRAYVSLKKPLPEEYRNVIMGYYRGKTELKGTGQFYEYVKSKNKLNAIYGMSAQDPIHARVTLLPDGTYQKSNYETEITEKNLLRAPFPYQWGVWVTSYTRFQLHRAMKAVPRFPSGVSRLVYIDTDSLKVVGKMDIDALNDERRRKAESAGATAIDSKGKTHFIGTFDNDGHYDRFITLGAKRYAYENADGLHVTVSGVSHIEHEHYDENGILTNKIEFASEELRALENFKEGFIWKSRAGGTTVVYNDQDDFNYTVDGRNIRITRNASIVPVTYTMKLADDYRNLLEMTKHYLDYLKEFE